MSAFVTLYVVGAVVTGDCVPQRDSHTQACLSVVCVHEPSAAMASDIFPKHTSSLDFVNFLKLLTWLLVS